MSTLNKTLREQWLVVHKDVVGLDHSADAWLEAAKELATEAEARRQAEALHAREAEAHVQEQAQASSMLRRRALLLAGVGVVAVLLAIAAGVFSVQSLTEQAEAERQARVALSRQLALTVGD